MQVDGKVYFRRASAFATGDHPMTRRTNRIVTAIAIAISVSALGVCGLQSIAEGDTSVLAQKEKEANAQSSELELSAPANGPTLPPPAMPQSLPDSVQREAAEEEMLPAPPRREVKRPFMRAAEPKRRELPRAELTSREEAIIAPDEFGPEEFIPGPETIPGSREIYESDIEVRPAPRIKYDTDGDARRMYRRSGEINVVMIAKNPSDGCLYEIPMCIPACCVGEPIVSGGRGIFGRGVVEYRWACGFRAVVKFRQVLGDVRVDYEGD
jgi:hypothetical protein